MRDLNEPQGAQGPKSVVLVGMMGAGKTTLGRRLAPRLGLAFHDADAEIEKAAGMSISELFERHGAESFRDGEARVIERLLGGPPHVLATGGGAVIRPETRALIAERAISVWIKADVEILAQRATRRDTRPLLRDGDPKAVLSKLLDERASYYAAADIHVETRKGPHDATVEKILAALAAYRASAREAAKEPT